MSDAVQDLIDDATYDFAMGEGDSAVAKLRVIVAEHGESFEAWHALAEVLFSLRRFDEALAAGEKAHALRPDDLFINTTMSRIWMERGDKSVAEKFGARAKVLGWKDQLKEPSGGASGQVN